MQSAGLALGTILCELLKLSTAGISLKEIEALAMAKILQSGGKPSFTTVGNYKWATCLCVNDVIVHGIPTEYVLKDQDVLTIDIGMLRDGFHTDTAWSKVIGNPQKEVKQFLEVGESTMVGN